MTPAPLLARAPHLEHEGKGDRGDCEEERREDADPLGSGPKCQEWWFAASLLACCGVALCEAGDPRNRRSLPTRPILGVDFGSLLLQVWSYLRAARTVARAHRPPETETPRLIRRQGPAEAARSREVADGGNDRSRRAHRARGRRWRNERHRDLRSLQSEREWR
jgi:hypothetical protein